MGLGEGYKEIIRTNAAGGGGGAAGNHEERGGLEAAILQRLARDARAERRQDLGGPVHTGGRGGTCR